MDIELSIHFVDYQDELVRLIRFHLLVLYNVEIYPLENEKIVKF